MRFGVCVACFLVFFSAVATPAKKPAWIKVTTKNFELYTTAGEKKGRETILRFEQVRGFFAQSTNVHPPSDQPVRIVAFHSNKEYEPYRANEGAAAYYLAGRHRDLIVIGDARDDQVYSISVHEYVHLLVRHSGIEPPVWFNEGLAEMYSTLQPYGGKVAVGAVPASRYQHLRRSKWLDLETLLSVTYDSRHYNEKERMGVFYSQSWALTHMLYLSEEYRPKFQDFVRNVVQGDPAERVFQEIYGKSLEQVTKDLRFYLRGDRMRVAMFDLKLEKSAEQPSIGPAPNVESGLVLAEMLTHLRKGHEARAMLEDLAKEHPREPGVFEALAYLDLSEQRWEQAVARFRQAAELGAASPTFYYDYAMIVRRSGGTAADAIPILQKAVELKPDFAEALLSLGFDLVSEGRHAEALRALVSIKSVKEEQAVAFYRALAYVHHRLRHDEGADKALQLASKYARTPEEKSAVESLRQGISVEKEERGAVVLRLAEAGGTDAEPTDFTPTLKRKQPQTEETQVLQADPALRGMETIEGVLHELHCSGKTAKLTILAEGQPKTFLIDDPSQVTVRHSGNASIDLACGRQNPTPVLLRYVAPAVDGADVLGLVRGLELVERE